MSILAFIAGIVVGVISFTLYEVHSTRKAWRQLTLGMTDFDIKCINEEYARRKKSQPITNREWLIWTLMDMSDKEFADRVCGNREVWSCDDCVENKINDYGCQQDCHERFHKWLKQEHKENGNDGIQREVQGWQINTEQKAGKLMVMSSRL